MEHRGTGADERRGAQQQCVAVGEGEQQQADEREAHARRQRVGPWGLVGERADQRLQQRGGDLEGEGQQPDLREGQPIGALQHRIQRRQERLHHVVQQVREADRGEDADGGAADRAGHTGSGG